MANDRKIEINTPNLLVKYRGVVKVAIEKGVREALAKHKAAGNPIAVSRGGKVILLQPREVSVASSSIEELWSGNEDDIYAELLNK